MTDESMLRIAAVGPETRTDQTGATQRHVLVDVRGLLVLDLPAAENLARQIHAAAEEAQRA